MSNPVVSIILPVYNVEAYLAECLSSVLAQSYLNYELICINDGATDSSLKILESFLSDFDNKMYIKSQENAGLSVARNMGLNLAKGKYIYFLDSDDWILPDTIQLCIDNITKHDAELVVFNAKAFCDGTEFEGVARLNYERALPKPLYSGESIFVDTYRGSYIAQSCCYFYKKEAFSELRFIPGILHEDHYFSTVLYLESKKTVVLENRFFNRRVRPDSITTGKITLRHAEGYYITVQALEKKFNNGGFNPLLKQLFREYLNSLLRDGVKAENRVSQEQGRKMSFARKLNITGQFWRVMNVKTTTLIFFSGMFYYMKSVLGRR